ncbi:MAG: MarR family transcriptional regulator [Clostridia bacterium]|nr:MarR family transcriptional regulator [Clostridia bacterium]
MTKDKHLGFEIRTLNNCVKRFVLSNKPTELDKSTGVHGWAIRYFYENRDKDVFQRDFEARFSIRRSTATNMLKLMEKNGIIIREKVPYDARLKKIVLTDRAIEIHKKATDNINMIESTLKKGISQDELITFYRVADKIKANLEVQDD